MTQEVAGDFSPNAPTAEQINSELRWTDYAAQMLRPNGANGSNGVAIPDGGAGYYPGQAVAYGTREFSELDVFSKYTGETYTPGLTGISASTWAKQFVHHAMRNSWNHRLCIHNFLDRHGRRCQNLYGQRIVEDASRSHHDGWHHGCFLAALRPTRNAR